MPRKNNLIIFNLNLMLLPIKFDLIPKKQTCKKYTLIIFSFNNFEIVFILLTKTIRFYMQVL